MVDEAIPSKGVAGIVRVQRVTLPHPTFQWGTAVGTGCPPVPLFAKRRRSCPDCGTDRAHCRGELTVRIGTLGGWLWICCGGAVLRCGFFAREPSSEDLVFTDTVAKNELDNKIEVGEETETLAIGITRSNTRVAFAQ